MLRRLLRPGSSPSWSFRRVESFGCKILLRDTGDPCRNGPGQVKTIQYKRVTVDMAESGQQGAGASRSQPLVRTRQVRFSQSLEALQLCAALSGEAGAPGLMLDAACNSRPYCCLQGASVQECHGNTCTLRVVLSQKSSTLQTAVLRKAYLLQ